MKSVEEHLDEMDWANTRASDVMGIQADAIGACLLEIEMEAVHQERLGFKHEAAAVRKAAERIKKEIMP